MNSTDISMPIAKSSSSIAADKQGRETTVSARIGHLVIAGTGWRQRVAVWVRGTLLATFDLSGRHG